MPSGPLRHNADIRYINPAAAVPPEPTYPGHYYDALIPATLDLAERAALAVNALTECTDPAYDYELYWIVDLLATQPAMYHSIDDHVQDKFFLALPLCRTACGSTQNLDVEHHLMWTYLRKQGPDGHIYLPIKGRPWALPAHPNPWAGLDDLPSDREQWSSVVVAGRVLSAFSVYAVKGSSGPWRDAAKRLADALRGLCIVEGDVAYLSRNWWQPGMTVVTPEQKPVGFRAAVAGWVALGLAEYHQLLGDDEALDTAAKLMRYVFRDSGHFGPNGEFREEFPGSPSIHFHAHTCQIQAALHVVQETKDEELLELALKAYAFAVREGEPLVGFFPEWLGYKGGGYGEGQFTSEICEVADMIMSALRLSLIGVDRWDDVDRWVRNQFAECQLTTTNWLDDGHMERVDRRRTPLPGAGAGQPEYGTGDRVAERAIGSFSGWPSANDFVQGNGWSIMHCCTGNGTRAIYHVWKHILTCRGRTLRVNLLLNRASQWADVDSHIPFKGQVDIRMKQDVVLEVRLPEWAEPTDVACTVNGRAHSLAFDARYARVGRVVAGDIVTIAFPIRERSASAVIEKHTYRLVRRGNDVVAIDPPGRNNPLYQRGHHRTGTTLWKKARRFAPEREIG